MTSKTPGIKDSQSHPLDSLFSLRKKLLKGILIVLSILGMPALIIACLEAFELHQIAGMILYLILYLSVVATTLAFNRLPFIFSFCVMLGSLYVISLFNLVFFSFSGAGIEIFVTITVLATVLLGIRSGLIAGGLCLVSIIGAGLGFLYGMLPITPEMPATTDHLISWLTAGGLFTLLAGTLILGSGMLQEHLIHSTETVHRQADELSKANGKLSEEMQQRSAVEEKLRQAQKMESVGRLAGGVAHDFNNMLGVILGHVEFALEKAVQDHDLHADLKEIQKAAQRSADITKQLLAFARKQTIAPRQLDLNDTVESMLNMLRRLIGEDIDLVWRPDAHLWPVKMDPSQIDQILVNLCVNARDAIAGVGKLTIETGRHTFDAEYCNEHPGFIPGDFVLLAVSDNGCGMDKNTLDNLFEPFFTTKEVGKGTGLGLATIYGIVKQNNGFINVYSEPGQGSIFKIYLPRLVVDEDIDKAVPEKNSATGGTETILLVEDEPTILRMTRMMLEKKGYSVLPAATPAEAIDLAKTHADRIHLLMTDVVMPEMNGRDLAGRLTSLYPDIKLLFMSGYTSNVIAHHGVLDDGVSFIQKPFSMAEMTEKVREVLDKKSDETQINLVI
jgi:signal transduction histidine kinase/ActR/RegA family two-component response regulator